MFSRAHTFFMHYIFSFILTLRFPSQLYCWETKHLSTFPLTFIPLGISCIVYNFLHPFPYCYPYPNIMTLFRFSRVCFWCVYGETIGHHYLHERQFQVVCAKNNPRGWRYYDGDIPQGCATKVFKTSVEEIYAQRRFFFCIAKTRNWATEPSGVCINLDEAISYKTPVSARNV